MRYTELERLICAGAISGQFRSLLLADPLQAAAAGYGGQSFRLSREELDFIAGLRAVGFQHFAQEVGEWIALHRNGHNGTGMSQEDPLRLPVYRI